MEKITRLTERDLTRLIKRVISEQRTEDLNKLKLCGPGGLAFMKQVLAREPQINIQVHPTQKEFLIITPPPNLKKPACVCKREDILKLS
jgi:hypothetical protein